MNPPRISRGMVEATLVGGETVIAHNPSKCAEQDRCAVHKPSEHSMSAFPQHWRDDRALMERICPHGVGHPDPDHLHFMEEQFGAERARVESIHGCCGCCATPTIVTMEQIDRVRNKATELWNIRIVMREKYGVDSKPYRDAVIAYDLKCNRVAHLLNQYHRQNPPTRLVEAQWSPITPENAPFPEKE